MLAALLLALAPPGSAELEHYQFRIPETPWVVGLDVRDAGRMVFEAPEWDERDREWKLLEGLIGSKHDLLTLRTVSEASAALVGYKQGDPFECQGLHCLDASVTIAKDKSIGNMAAHLDVGGLRFELRLLRMQDKLQRKEFEGLLKSFRVLLLRRGAPQDYPEPLAQALTQCAFSSPGREGWKKGYLAKHPTDWTAQFAEAEFRRLEQAPPKEQLESYERAAYLLSKVTSLKPEERCARALCSEGLGLARYDAQLFPESAAALEQSCADLEELKRPELSEVSFELALSLCRAGSLETSLAALRRAIAGLPRLRERAALEPYFEGLRKLPEFLKLVGLPAPDPGK